METSPISIHSTEVRLRYWFHCTAVGVEGTYGKSKDVTRAVNSGDVDRCDSVVLTLGIEMLLPSAVCDIPGRRKSR